MRERERERREGEADTARTVGDGGGELITVKQKRQPVCCKAVIFPGVIMLVDHHRDEPGVTESANNAR